MYQGVQDGGSNLGIADVGMPFFDGELGGTRQGQPVMGCVRHRGR
ncbi:MAG: hypothetical protein QG552_3684 [Thermodesulfobacteriota bacterium]|nr:hypothetical protein [Thermodesulfobacteriota bacterium]